MWETNLRKATKVNIGIILTIATLLCGIDLNAQTRTLMGRVIAEDSDPLPGLEIKSVTNVILGKTDMEGRFNIIIPQDIDRLSLTYLGMETTEIKLMKDCDTIEVIMMYDVIYDFITLRKVDRLRKKRFDKLFNIHADAVKSGLFENSLTCYQREFREYNSPKAIR
ncbi:MAG: hypothetical protein EOO47_06630 [Flavobacterium sp.]|nr:MAG: hypothetical protein EOO47_06630 [Flavobacterium sp.]